MPKSEQHVVINAPIVRVFQVITDYTRYPDFLQDMKSVKILAKDDGVVVACFELQLIVRIQYTLRMIEDAPTRVSWSLTNSNMITHNTGYWQLEALGAEVTRVVYYLDVTLAGMIPKSLRMRLLDTELPHTLQLFKERIENYKDL